MSSERQDSSGPISGEFCPPSQGSLESWLARITQIGGPLVEDFGLPQIREPGREPWATEAAYLGFEVRAHTPAATLARLVLGRETAKAVSGAADKQPGRNVRFCLEAAKFRRIKDRSESEIGAYLKLTPQADTRNVRRIIRTGDFRWAALGAWPWALYPDGKLPATWRADPLVARELESWHERARAEAITRHLRDAGRLRRARLRASKPED